jgi:hypothetical protein
MARTAALVTFPAPKARCLAADEPAGGTANEGSRDAADRSPTDGRATDHEPLCGRLRQDPVAEPLGQMLLRDDLLDEANASLSSYLDDERAGVAESLDRMAQLGEHGGLRLQEHPLICVQLTERATSESSVSRTSSSERGVSRASCCENLGIP